MKLERNMYYKNKYSNNLVCLKKKNYNLREKARKFKIKYFFKIKE